MIDDIGTISCHLQHLQLYRTSNRYQVQNIFVLLPLLSFFDNQRVRNSTICHHNLIYSWSIGFQIQVFTSNESPKSKIKL